MFFINKYKGEKKFILQDMEYFSLMPPVTAVVLALLTKEPVISLIIGAFSGCLIITKFNLINSVKVMFDIMSTQIKDSIYILFCF